MPIVKKIIGLAAFSLFALLAFAQAPSSQAIPAAPTPAPLPAPARADLAEAVFAMVLQNAHTAGLTMSQPITLCEACVAAHLGLPHERVRDRCDKACGLR